MPMTKKPIRPREGQDKKTRPLRRKSHPLLIPERNQESDKVALEKGRRNPEEQTENQSKLAEKSVGRAKELGFGKRGRWRW